MEVAHLNQKQLAARWNISEATLERWRSEGLGPKFLKLCGRVLYRQVDIDPDGHCKFPHPWPPRIPPGRTPGL